MRLVDRVLETTATTGSGALALAGAATGYQAFSPAYPVGERLSYAIELPASAEWEVGVGYLSGATTLVRETVYASSNAGALVNFSAGTKNVFVTIAATDDNRKPDIGLVLALPYAF
jgi:hypothetical protein